MMLYEKYIEDKRFIKWVFQPDDETEHYFEHYLTEHPEERETMIQLKEELKQLSFSGNTYSEELPNRIYTKLQAQIIRLEKQKRSRSRTINFIKYAAIGMLLLATGILADMLGYRITNSYKFSEDLLLIGTMVEPRLYFADGTNMKIPGPDYSVDYSHPGVIIVGRDTINQTTAYKKSKDLDLLVVAHGKRVNICLPDSSTVWVNSGSRLIFPHKFGSKKREVYLFGEGYFDVEKNPEKPFLVRTTSMEVKVLGTEFNVSAYPENEKIETVLKEGSVQIENTSKMLFAEKAILKPNEKATFDKISKNIEISKVEHKDYTLWKDGLITIDDQTLPVVISKIEKYFNVDIQIADKHKEAVRISGKIDFNAGIDRVFRYLEQLTDGQFVADGPGKYIFK